MDIQNEIEALDNFEKVRFPEMGIPELCDNEMYIAKESYVLKFEQSQVQEKKEAEANVDPNEPKIIPNSKTEFAMTEVNKQIYEISNEITLLASKLNKLRHNHNTVKLAIYSTKTIRSYELTME